MNKQVNLVVNTLRAKRDAVKDENAIRTAAAKNGHGTVKSLQEYRASIEGLRERLSAYRYQYCQFHQLQTMRHKPTNHPKLPASIKLMEISKLHCHTDKESFIGVSNEWFVRRKIFLKERTRDGEGRSRYTHKNSRSAYLSPVQNGTYRISGGEFKSPSKLV